MIKRKQKFNRRIDEISSDFHYSSPIRSTHLSTRSTRLSIRLSTRGTRLSLVVSVCPRIVLVWPFVFPLVVLVVFEVLSVGLLIMDP